MAASSEEIARDILVAAASGSPSCPSGEWLGEQYKAILKAVGEARQEEVQAMRRRT